MKTKLFLIMTIAAITILGLIYWLYPDHFIPTLIIISYTYGFFQVMFHRQRKYLSGKTPYVKRDDIFPVSRTHVVGPDSQTPIKL